MFKLKEISPNLYRFTGSRELWTSRTKYVEVDGEQYQKTRRFPRVFTAEELYDEAWSIHTYEYDFKLLNLMIKIEFPQPNEDAFNRGYSGNNKVDFILNAFNSGLLDGRIKDLFTAKDPLNSFHKCSIRERYASSYDAYRDCILFNEAPICLDRYGFNNGIYYKVSTVSLLKAEYEHIPREMLDWFINEKIFTPTKNIKTNTFNLLTKKLNIYEGDRHKITA